MFGRVAFFGTKQRVRPTGFAPSRCQTQIEEDRSFQRKHVQEIDFGKEYQLVFELRPAHDPTKTYGFVNCVLGLRRSQKWSLRPY